MDRETSGSGYCDNMKGNLDYSKGSWHYKIIFFVWMNYHHWRPVPTNLCPYLRKLCISIPALPFFVIWRKLPKKVTDHQTTAQILFGYGVLVHLGMFIITILLGGEYMDRVAELETSWYDCTIPYDITTCFDRSTGELISINANTNDIDFRDFGETIRGVERYQISEELVKIDWWWGWAFYVLSVIVATVGIGALFGLFALVDKLQRRPKGTSLSKLGIVSDYMEAKHNKICPCINFTEVKEKEKDG